ncbi:Hypothetical predicted protein [Mytilus galloprovincialis]|uniref:Uncharacterized protein n=1 Tax=Mytilus galloprovincialis TaxID=29158 RepID=A0A8B6F373_MYTGA|nr:Hypothetical predicted protein [Mytilus galloprovincialis]
MGNGLNQMVRHETIRENHGPAMIRFWRQDMLQFHQHHHPKYLILGHRLLTNRIYTSANSNMLTDDVIARHVELSGGIDPTLDSLYQYSVATRTADFHSNGSKRDNEKDIITFCKLLRKKN